MKENFTSINVIIDRSGSMKKLEQETISGYNTFIEEQKKVPGEAVLTLAIFDDQYELVHDCINIQDVPVLNNDVYYARGYTALLDALGKTINATGAKLAAMKEEDRPSKVLFLIMTDGEENASVEFLGDAIKDMVSHQKEKYNWEFVFMGAGIDVITAGKNIGISASNSYSYNASSVGTKKLFSNVSGGTAKYRSSPVRASYVMPKLDSDDK